MAGVMSGLTAEGRDLTSFAPAPVRRRGAPIRVQVLVLTLRSIKVLVLDPRMILLNAMGPLLMLLIFSQIFGSISATPQFPRGVSYIDFLVPAIMVNSAMQAALQTGISLTQEVRSGIISRFRSLPIWLGSILFARSLADLVRSGLQLICVLLFAYALFGFSPAGGISGVFAAWILALTVGGGIGWLFIALACWIRNIDLFQGTTMLVTFPLMFASSAFVPVGGFPEWLRFVATLNPMTYGIDATRALVFGHPVGYGPLVAVVLSLVTIGFSAAVAVRGFRRPL
ncbi:ABC transporter permease [Streptosporangium sp. NPDC051022]|uniref:ABC transporter permease n=1 Tax=Streptosporangium sp. NPDC051022 TaxID=3155752 RepID=UPI0034142A8F